MRHQIILMAMMFTLITCPALADEEACVENFHVIGHDIRVAYVTGNLQNPAIFQSVEFKNLPLSETYCDIPSSSFHLVVYYMPTLNEQRAYPGATSDEVLVTTEEFSLASGDYLGFTLSSDESGNLKILYARPMKNQFSQVASVARVSVPRTLSHRQN